MPPTFRDKFKAKSTGLAKQHVTQVRNKDTKGRFPSIVIKEKLPAGVEIWQIKEGQHMFDVIPFFAGPDFPIDPETGVASIEKGDLAYVLDIRVHQNIGPMKMPFVCPYENFGLPCPICEYIKNNDVDTEDWKRISPKRRVFYLVWVHDSRETQRKGIQLLEMSHFSMEEKLAEVAALPLGGGAENFSDIDTGKTVCVTRKGTGAKNTQYLGHKFIARQIKIPDGLLAKVFPIDSVLKMHPKYEEIEEAFKAQRGSMSTQEDVENAGAAFAGGRTDDDIPDWMGGMGGDEAPPISEPDPKPVQTSTTVKRKLVLRRK